MLQQNQAPVVREGADDPALWLPLRALDRQTFAADILFNAAAEENFPRKMPADAWFDFKGSDRFEVTEQSFLLPDEELLTVLILPDAAVA